MFTPASKNLTLPCLCVPRSLDPLAQSCADRRHDSRRRMCPSRVRTVRPAAPRPLRGGAAPSLPHGLPGGHGVWASVLDPYLTSRDPGVSDLQFTPHASTHHAQLLRHSAPCASAHLGMEPICDHSGVPTISKYISVNTSTTPH